jgi:hypothetical protein
MPGRCNRAQLSRIPYPARSRYSFSAMAVSKTWTALGKRTGTTTPLRYQLWPRRRRSSAGPELNGETTAEVLATLCISFPAEKHRR